MNQKLGQIMCYELDFRKRVREEFEKDGKGEKGEEPRQATARLRIKAIMWLLLLYFLHLNLQLDVCICFSQPLFLMCIDRSRAVPLEEHHVISRISFATFNSLGRIELTPGE